MRLRDVANVFNNLPCYDAYTGALAFMGQMAPYDDNKRDGVIGERRVLSISPGDVVPSRRVIAAYGTQYIIGHETLDDWRGKTIRVGCVVHEADYLSQVRTFAEVCLDLPGFTAYSGRVFVKDVSYSLQESDLVPQNDVHFSTTEPVLANMTVTFKGTLNLVRAVNFGAGGMLSATCEVIEEPSVQFGTIQLAGAYDPVTQTTPSAPFGVRVVRLRWQSLYAYRSGIAPKFQPGDIQLAIAKAAAPHLSAGTTITLPDGAWMIDSALDEGDVWVCRAVRNA